MLLQGLYVLFTLHLLNFFVEEKTKFRKRFKHIIFSILFLGLYHIVFSGKFYQTGGVVHLKLGQQVFAVAIHRM